MIDISDLAESLRARDARTVALQFPAGLKRQSFHVASALREEGFFVVISGNPCYGACDLDLSILDFADVLVHFGHSPLSSHPRVLHVPYFLDFNPGMIESAFPLLKGTRVGIVTTIQHSHMTGRVEEFLVLNGYEPVVAEGGGRTPGRGQVLGCSFTAARMPGVHSILFIGTGLFHPLGVQLASGAHVVAVDPYTGHATEVNADRFLRRRFALIERARNAKNYGIIISTKSGQNRIGLAAGLAQNLQRSFLIFMDEVSPDELRDLGFECYVNTACPRLSYDDQDRFPVPVLSPYEAEILTGSRSWDDYRIDEIE